MTYIKQRYFDTTDFPPTVRTYTEIAKIVREKGLLKRATKFYATVAAILVLAFAGTTWAFFMIGHSWFQLIIGAVLGVLLTQVAFLAHEAAHRQILKGGPNNDRLATFLAASIGMSYSWWDSKHSRHHANPNRVDKDPDIAVDVISFTEKDAKESTGIRRWITARQGWLFFPLLTLEGINLHFQSFKHLFSRGKIKTRTIELSIIATRFLLYFGLLFAFLPLGMAFAFLGIQLIVFGVYMGASFAPNHKGMPIIAPEAKLDFFSKQVRTSRNIAGGWWATILMGGLNYQIEHHLFPSMARPHLSQAKQIVEQACRNQKIPYVETSLWKSYAIVIRYLNGVGLQARDPFECPIISRYRRS